MVEDLLRVQDLVKPLSPWRIDPHHRVEDRDQLPIHNLMLLPIQILLYQVVMLVLELGAMEETEVEIQLIPMVEVIL